MWFETKKPQTTSIYSLYQCCDGANCLIPPLFKKQMQAVWPYDTLFTYQTKRRDKCTICQTWIIQQFTKILFCMLLCFSTSKHRKIPNRESQLHTQRVTRGLISNLTHKILVYLHILRNNKQDRYTNNIICK